MFLHKRKLLVTFILASFILLGMAAPHLNHASADQHKNLKVLPKDISDDSLDMIMDGFKASLGVKCSFCHAPQKDDPTHLDFPSDDKPEKDIARHMMLMTMDINQRYFNFSDSTDKNEKPIAVTCTTCHRGDPHPVVKHE